MPLDAGVVGAAINGVGSVVDGIMQGAQNRKNRRFALDMWNRENAYNTPAAQMARFKDAGLNPNLIYGNGSASAGNAGSVQNPTTRPVSIGNPIGSYLQARQSELQNSNIDKMNSVYDAQIAKMSADTMKSISETKGVDLSNTLKGSTLTDMISQVKANLANTVDSNSLINANIDKALASSESIRSNTALNPYRRASLIAGVKNVASEIQLRKSQGRSVDLRNVEQEIRNRFWSNGVNPNSGAVDQVIKSVLDGFDLSPSGNLKGWFNKNLNPFRDKDGNPSKGFNFSW